mgnify:FL=1
MTSPWGFTARRDVIDVVQRFMAHWPASRLTTDEAMYLLAHVAEVYAALAYLEDESIPR